MQQVHAVIDALQPLSLEPITMHDALWTVRSLLRSGEVQWPLRTRTDRACVPTRCLFPGSAAGPQCSVND
jgi:hypothetical protein